jgi:hypothetical protein
VSCSRHSWKRTRLARTFRPALMQALQAANLNGDFVQQAMLWNLFGL